jgi:hypothetical protein
LATRKALRTKDKATALRLLHSKSEAYQLLVLYLQIAQTDRTVSERKPEDFRVGRFPLR